MRRALTFHASFDHGLDADFARGDRALYHATSFDTRAAAQPDQGASEAALLAVGQGRFGHALRFGRDQSGLVFFQAARNTAYNPTNWNGTVSFWLNLDPALDLEPGFCEPLQVTARAWNDAAFSVEFEKRREAVFRLGVFADYDVWNPQHRRWDEIAAWNKPVLSIPKPPFRAGQWTHVVFTFEHFNTRLPTGIVRLYLNGQEAGALPPRQQTFSWDERQAAILVGVGFQGLFDELSWFDRALNADEIRFLHELDRGVSSLLWH